MNSLSQKEKKVETVKELKFLAIHLTNKNEELVEVWQEIRLSRIIFCNFLLFKIGM